MGRGGLLGFEPTGSPSFPRPQGPGTDGDHAAGTPEAHSLQYSGFQGLRPPLPPRPILGEQGWGQGHSLCPALPSPSPRWRPSVLLRPAFPEKGASQPGACFKKGGGGRSKKVMGGGS